MANRTDIWVYAHWRGMDSPKCIGVLSAQQAKGRNAFSLSPAYDINPSADKDGLTLNIDTNNNSLDLELAKSVGVYFRLGEEEMNLIIKKIKSSVANWQKNATELGISRIDQKLMSAAFRM